MYLRFAIFTFAGLALSLVLEERAPVCVTAGRSCNDTYDELTAFSLQPALSPLVDYCGGRYRGFGIVDTTVLSEPLGLLARLASLIPGLSYVIAQVTLRNLPALGQLASLGLNGLKPQSGDNYIGAATQETLTQFGVVTLNPYATIEPGPEYKTIDLKSAYIGCLTNLDNPLVIVGQGCVISAIAQYANGTKSSPATFTFTPKMLLKNPMQQITFDERVFTGVVKIVFGIASATLPPVLSIFNVDNMVYCAHK
ncbi:hypothetical protein CLAFUW4_13162 [Fulvia fulva]|uniref:Secreted protein n=1 Tax=Passalora fulva TaxID=5499 RepID=A0A9Q8UVK8_PASFU|nr:uncharacterized protein CLAFUR5_13020 [Fulvia fulva]KAK4612084.1 hypothetical protein CLAFUR4_13167 [Fulvia fulva]UJO24010.1 hypothetical protein CLAFUR5_13020 [Fulvia fulva]WPV20877.1 hypothetical protein CLAFUW4_13162 [Fulvia fulva]WPV36101.1 hypothetical protein CLAFUW7_13170 [Fulvia fulva]